MPWIERDGRRYYYRKKRIGDRVVSEYIPRDVAELAAALDERRRRAWLAARAELVEATLRAAGPDAEVKARFTAAKAAFEEHMNDRGYHRHKRQWRRARTVPSDSDSG